MIPLFSSKPEALSHLKPDCPVSWRIKKGANKDRIAVASIVNGKVIVTTP